MRTYTPAHKLLIAPSVTSVRCGKFAEAIMKSTTELETVVTIVYANQRQMRRTDPLKKYMDVIADQAGALRGGRRGGGPVQCWP